MKKIIGLLTFSILLFFAVSCEKEGKEKDIVSLYIINNKSTVIQKAAEENIALHMKLFFFELNDKNEIIAQRQDDFGTKSRIVHRADERAEKIAIEVNYRFIKGGSNGLIETKTQKWIQQVYYLKKGGTIEIDFTDSTIQGSNRPY